MTRSINDTLLSFVGRTITDDILVKPTKLFPIRSMVDNINISEMNKSVRKRKKELLFMLAHRPQIRIEGVIRAVEICSVTERIEDM